MRATRNVNELSIVSCQGCALVETTVDFAMRDLSDDSARDICNHIWISSAKISGGAWADCDCIVRCQWHRHACFSRTGEGCFAQ